MNSTVFNRSFVCLVLVSLFLLLSCSDSSDTNSSSLELPDSSSASTKEVLNKIISSGKLIVLTTNQPTTYYMDRDGNATGPEHDMAVSFANHLDVEVEFQQHHSIGALLSALKTGQGHIAAAGTTITDKRKNEFDFGPTYQEISEYLVCHKDHSFVSTIDELKQFEIVVSAASSYVDLLHREYPGINWSIDTSNLTPDLLRKVENREIECTVSDSNIFDINRRYLPEISVKYILHKGSKLAWMVNKDNPELIDEINDWLKAYRKSGQYDQKIEKYYGHIEVFDYVDIHRFRRKIENTLPKYHDMFLKAAKKHDISPAILAAQSYQESHWNPRAKSPTGVRGMMMLTQPVAKSLGVKSRLDAESNIYAGAKFHAKMKKMFDDNVQEPDRTWLALAAYNVGRGHFRDAQSLARKLGKDPELWLDMKEVLPLLSKKKYYKDLKYGYARGNEPVQYVTRIRDYADILRNYFVDADLNDVLVPKQKNSSKS